MRLIATIRPTETREITTQSQDYADAKAAAAAPISVDWEIISYRAIP